MLTLSLYNYAEMLALIASIIFYKNLFKTPFLILIPYLLMTVAAELTGNYLGIHHRYKENVNLFNITTVIEFVIFYFLFYKNINSAVLKNIILYAMPLYVVLAAVNQLFIQGFNNFHTYTMLVGTVFIIVFVFFYFYEAFSDKEPLSLPKEPMFWISIGLFLFYLGDFTYNLMQPYFIKNHMQKESFHLFHIINNNLIIFEYICFSIAIFVCSNNRLASKLQS
ncbi:hypothetical protein MUGA111182_13550 [Mucilaginibacter galii]|uniref:Uncharacterized protein n=1 Tax=Mucilaginibacter galii TaxID=2005073 RepID=A0A917J6Y3_9SPHI|nr:hypothetical protein [Mucilaginibacter galii]GGI49212.1 hypothetical protein GCM10011425_04240 [Mucilaginibacter galii]